LVPPDKGLPVDLTPDPATDKEGADKFAALNNGLIDRIEIEG